MEEFLIVRFSIGNQLFDCRLRGQWSLLFELWAYACSVVSSVSIADILIERVFWSVRVCLFSNGTADTLVGLLHWHISVHLRLPMRSTLYPISQADTEHTTRIICLPFSLVFNLIGYGIGSGVSAPYIQRLKQETHVGCEQFS
jgi:hypothetical protein